MSITTVPDAIDALLGIEHGSSLDELRRRRPVTRENAQASFAALFTPADPGTVTSLERWAVATFVAALHEGSALHPFAAEELSGVAGHSAIDGAIAAEAARAVTAGADYRVGSENRALLGERLAAALDHTALLVLRPRDSSPEALEALLGAEWSTTDIVTLSQLVAFLTFQIRVVAGLELLA